ncbi:MAG: radical SAM protein [Theionarchaea archaeon]|nr:radical SAM protein [Theionarchaea archaeon]MBU7037893.1 radical SAM protein [Theionarchaea archaeon]
MKRTPVIHVGEDEFLLYNPVSKVVDVVDSDVVTALESGTLPPDMREYLERHGHLTMSDDEAEAWLKEECYRSHATLADSPAYYIIPTYNCNMRCIYCYEKDLRREPKIMSSRTVEQVFSLVESRLVDTIILYGGEPFQKGTKPVIEQIARLSRETGCRLSACTNGLELLDSEPLFDYFSEIIVTLDGVEPVQNFRRPSVGGPSFSTVIRSIERVIETGTPVTISVNADAQNVESLPELADFFIEKGWHTHPSVHIAVSHILQPLDRTYPYMLEPKDAAQKMVELHQNYPSMELFQESFKGLNPLVNVFFKGEEWRPRYWYCRANCYMLLFDPYNYLYPCYMVVGRPSFAVGRFSDTIEESPSMAAWRERTCFTIPQCRECALGCFCGGGCAYRQYRRSGSFSDPYCDTVEALITYYVPFLYEKVKERGDRL